MSTTMDPQAAHSIVVDLHKRAFLGRLKQYGIEPTNEKEAAALLDLGWDLFVQQPTDPAEKSASTGPDYGDGQFAQAKRAFDEHLASQEVAPGFALGKQASSQLANDLPQLPGELVDQAYNAAYELAHNPAIYNAALVKRAANEAAWAEANPPEKEAATKEEAASN